MENLIVSVTVNKDNIRKAMMDYYNLPKDSHFYFDCDGALLEITWEQQPKASKLDGRWDDPTTDVGQYRG